MEWKNYTNNTYPWPMLSMWPLSVFWPWPFPLLRSTFLVWLPFRTLFILIFYLKRQDQITWLIVKKVPTTERRLKELTAICKDCIPTSVAIRTCSAIFQWWESNKIKWQQKYFLAPRTFNFISLNLYIIDYSSRYAKVIVNVCNKTAIFFSPPIPDVTSKFWDTEFYHVCYYCLNTLSLILRIWVFYDILFMLQNTKYY